MTDQGIIARALVLCDDEATAAFNRLTIRVQELERENGELRKIAGLEKELRRRACGRANKAESELAAIKKRIADDYERGRQDGISFGPSVREQIDISRELDEDTLDDEAKS